MILRTLPLCMIGTKWMERSRQAFERNDTDAFMGSNLTFLGPFFLFLELYVYAFMFMFIYFSVSLFIYLFSNFFVLIC